MITRRRFLKYAAFAGLQTILPLRVESEDTTPSLPVNMYLENVPDDPIMNNYFENQTDSYLSDAIKKVWQYYDALGIDLEFILKEGSVQNAHNIDGSYKDITRNILISESMNNQISSLPVTVFYTSRDALKHYFCDYPRQFFYDTQGYEWLRKAEENTQGTLARFGVNNNPFLRQMNLDEYLYRSEFEAVWKEANLDGCSGLASKYSHRIYLYTIHDLLKPHLDEPHEFINYATIKLAHELGHIFWLDDSSMMLVPNLMASNSLIDLNGKNDNAKLAPLLNSDIPDLLPWEKARLTEWINAYRTKPIKYLAK